MGYRHARNLLCLFALSTFLLCARPSAIRAAKNIVVQDPGLDLETVMGRRVSRIRDSYHNPELALRHASQLLENGTWSDVDYTTGCPARRANWPIQEHFHRIITMATVWSTSLEPDLLSASISALDHWFSNDFSSLDCINAGGYSGLTCPCGTPGYWNTNWYCQMILMPGLVGSACLMLSPALTPAQLTSCSNQTFRSWVRVDGDPNGTQGPQTGANLLDVASIGESLALLTQDHGLLVQTLNRTWGECTLNEKASGDGIKVDGAFLQHDAQLYTGNYGKVFISQMLTAFLETKGTSLSPPPMEVQDAFRTLLQGSEWLIYRKTEEGEDGGELSWSYSAIGRMVSFKRADWHGIDLNFDRILEATGDWSEAQVFRDIVERLSYEQQGGWGLSGSRFFHTADFLVNRGVGYTTTLKMYSTRSTNSECNNGQSPYGYHLSDGAIYTQRTGREYTDVFGAWDWDLIPGTTNLYQSVPLHCSAVQTRGSNPRVGAVALDGGSTTDIPASVAIMTHVDPTTGYHSFTKTFFFFPSAYVVQFPEIWWDSSAVNGATMRTTLDQRQAGRDAGPVFVDGAPLPQDGTIQQLKGRTLWYDGVGYSFFPPNTSVALGVGLVERVANWSEIGISVGNETQQHFLAYIKHEKDVHLGGYVARLNVDQEEFQNSPQGNVTILPPTENVTAALFSQEEQEMFILGLAFLSPSNFSTGLDSGMIPWVAVDVPVLLIFQRDQENGWRLGVADHTPNQDVLPPEVNIAAMIEGVAIHRRVRLPGGPLAGSSVRVQI